MKRQRNHFLKFCLKDANNFDNQKEGQNTFANKESFFEFAGIIMNNRQVEMLPSIWFIYG